MRQLASNLFIAIAACIGSTAAAQPTCDLYPFPAWIVPTSIYATVFGDLNGDQSPDIAYVTYTNSLTVAYNDGHGRFVQGPSYALASLPSVVAMVDVDADRDGDLVTLHDSSGTLTVMRNQGDGTLLPPQTVACGLTPRSLSWGDIDVDGDPDLVIGNATFPPAITIMENQGAGQFIVMSVIGVFQHATATVLAPLNNDPWPDLVISTAPSFGSGSVTIRFSNGGASFGPAIPAANISASAVRAVDLDLDRDLDLVFGGSSVGYRLINDGFGGFKLAGMPPMSGSEVMDVGPVDDDSYPDLIVLDRADSSTFRVLHLKSLPGASFANPVQFVAIDEANALAAGDIDSDGDLDAMMANGAGVTRLENLGDGSFLGQRIIAFPFNGELMAPHDFDQDGDLDLFSTTITTVRYARNDGNLALAPQQFLPFTADGTIRQLIWSDVDGDGDEDALLSTSSGTLHIVKKTAPGALGPMTSFTASDGFLAAADFDGDGDRDVVVTKSGPQNSGTTVRYLANDGTGAFAPPVDVTVGTTPVSVCAADMDGDGDIDLVTGNNGFNGVAAVAVTLNQGVQAGSPVFAPPVITATDERPSRTSVGDLNGDGSPDVVVQFSRTLTGGLSNKLAVLLNDGNGALGSPAYYNVGISNAAPILRDVDSDGRLDIIATSGFGGFLFVLLNVGDGTFQTNTHMLLDGTSSMAADDFTGDGQVDVLTTHGSDKLAIMVRQPGFATILRQPAHVTAVSGGTLNLAATARAGEPIAYQWFRDLQPLVDDDRITGSATEALQIDSVVLGDAGEYRVRLAGASCAMTSAAGIVRILPPCAADIVPPSGNAIVNVQDLLAVIGAWGQCDRCDGDIDLDGHVGVQDLLLVISSWGECG